MHARNLSHDILKTRCIGIGDELVLSLLEEFIHASQLLLLLSHLLVFAG